MQLKVLSWNIWGGQFLPEIIEFLKRERPDIIGLQEATQEPGGENNLAKIIAEAMGYEYCYGHTESRDGTRIYQRLYGETPGKIVEMGNAILSKYRIVSTNVHTLSEVKRRIALQADIQLGDGMFHFFSSHLKHTHQKHSELQDLQARNLLAVMPKENTILMADLNAVPMSECVNIVSETLKDTDPESTAATWSVYPDGCPVCKPQALNIRLDYIFTTSDIKTTSFMVHDSKGSDHLPLSVIIDI